MLTGNIAIYYQVTYPLNIFIDFILEFSFIQIVDFPTREHNILDVFFTNCLSYEYTSKPLAGISDHEIVYATSAVDIELQKPISHRIYLWHKADFGHIKPLANSLADEFLTKYDDTPIEIFGKISNVYVQAVLDVYHQE